MAAKLPNRTDGEITRSDMVRVILGNPGQFMSVIFRRKRDKYQKVDGVKTLVEPKGTTTLVNFQNRGKAWDKPTPSGSFVPAGGHCFNAATAEEAKAIKDRNNLLTVMQVNEREADGIISDAGPKNIPVDNVLFFFAMGHVYVVIDD